MSVPAAAIVAAGGSGDRARAATGDLPKQFRELRGRALIEWSATALREAGCDPVVIVVPERHIDAARSLLGEQFLVTAGGDTRQGSVANGLVLIESERVVVHDGVRPFVTTDLLKRVLDAMDGVDGVVVGLPIDETVKRVEGDRVLHTVDRSRLWRVQTPQAFWTEKLKIVHRRAAADGIDATDDAALVESFGGAIRVVEGARTNIKVTHPEDFGIAEHLAERFA